MPQIASLAVRRLQARKTIVPDGGQYEK